MPSTLAQPTVRRLVSVVFGILWILSCATVCADDCRRVQNILVLFDASGNMKTRERYEYLLKQMKLFQQAIPVTADGFFNVGLRHYGLRVGMECDSTESIIAVQSWDPERFIHAFPQHVSYGTSALSAGLRGAAEDVAALPGKSMILLVGTGIESCKNDPIKIADRIVYNNPDLEIHCFQVGSEQEGRFNLSSIAEKAKGSYQKLTSVDSPAAWHGWMKRHLVVPCGGPAAPGGTAQPPGASGAAVAPPDIGPVVFDSNSFSIRSKNPAMDARNMQNVQMVGAFLKQNPRAKAVLHGFSDGKGAPDYNLKLSRRRAEAVAKHLEREFGIPESRVAIIAHGMSQDVFRTGRNRLPGQGRRVEFEIFR